EDPTPRHPARRRIPPRKLSPPSHRAPLEIGDTIRVLFFARPARRKKRNEYRVPGILFWPESERDLGQVLGGDDAGMDGPRLFGDVLAGDARGEVGEDQGSGFGGGGDPRRLDAGGVPALVGQRR